MQRLSLAMKAIILILFPLLVQAGSSSSDLLTSLQTSDIGYPQLQGSLQVTGQLLYNYAVTQNYFLQKMLGVRNGTDQEKVLAFQNALKEISIYMAEPEASESLIISDEKDLPALFALFESPYHRFKDDVQFSLPLSKAPKKAIQITNADVLQKFLTFIQARRIFDFEIPLSSAAAASSGKLGAKIKAAVSKLMNRSQSFFFLQILSSKNQKGRDQLLALSPTVQMKIAGPLTEELNKKVNRLQDVTTDLINSGQIKFQNDTDQRFFELLIATYYSELPEQMANDILKKMIERPDQNSANQMFELMVMYSGPQMQKLFQVIARRQGFSPEIQEVFKRVEDQGFATPWELAAPLLEQPPIGYEWVSIDPKPMVGTMAQTYRAVVKDQQGRHFESAARILKDGILQSMQDEEARLEHLAQVVDNDPLLRAQNFLRIRPILKDVKQMAQDETNIPKTTMNQFRGQAEYQKVVRTSSGLQVSFLVPETYESANRNVMFSAWVDGEKFEDFQAANPDAARLAAEELAKLWLETVLFKGRFFHSDLHQGNLKFKWVNQNTVQVGLLDFGMSGTLLEQDRDTMMKMGIAAKLGDDSSVANYIWNLSDPGDNLIDKSQFIREVLAHAQSGDADTSVFGWLNWSMSKGIKLKKDITSVSRGWITMSQLLENSGSNLAVDQIIFDLATKNHEVTVKAAATGFIEKVFSFDGFLPDLTRGLRAIPATPKNTAAATKWSSPGLAAPNAGSNSATQAVRCESVLGK